MSNKRFIEITAKSQQEAEEIARKELRVGETISGAEILVAPAKGIFGIVGSPETRVRFTIEPQPLPPEPAPIETAEPAPPPPPPPTFARRSPHPRPPRRRVESREPRHSSDDSFGEDDEAVALPSGENVESLTSGAFAPGAAEAWLSHPLHELVHQLVREVATNVGVSEIQLRDGKIDDTWLIEAAGGNVSQLIGKHGRTLDALQYLLNIIVNKGREDRTKLLLDVQGYRDKRHRGLILLANRMFRKVIDSGKQVELEPMSTLDRRTIHLALRDKTGIETFSKGVEPLRRVVISPRKSGSPRPTREPRHEQGPAREPAPPTRGKSVPMFMEGDSSDED